MSNKKVTPIVRRSVPDFSDEQIPPHWNYHRLVSQGIFDLNEAWLWVGRETFRKTLQGHIDWHLRGTLNQGALPGMWNIIHRNQELRDERVRVTAVPAATPQAPPPVAPAAVPAEDRIVCNPRLGAAQIAEGWGFATASVVNHFAQQCADFPKPIPDPSRTYPVRSYLEIQAWTDQHQAELRAKLQRNQRKESALVTELRRQLAEAQQGKG